MDIDTGKMLVKLYAPAIGLFLMWVVVDLAVRGVAANPMTASVGHEALRWVPFAIVVPAALYAYASWRFFQWNTGREPGCRSCGGILNEDLHRPCLRCLRCNRTEPL